MQLAAHSSTYGAHSAASCSGRPVGAPAPAPRWGARSAAGRRQGLAPALRATGQQHPEEDDRPKDGDSGLQDSLIKQLQFEIGKKRVDEFVEAEADNLRAKAEEGKAELDKLADLQNLRAEVAFNSALADINREADEFEEQLRRSREEREAAEREQAQWEDDVAVRRSQGQFFQSLYQPKGKGRAGAAAARAGAAGAADATSREEIKARADKVVEPARSEVGSWLRYYLFTFLAFVLAVEVGIDLQSDSPSAMQDVLYTLLVILLGVTAINERRTLL